MPGIIGGILGYQMLRYLGRDSARGNSCDGRSYRGRSKLEVLFGPQIWPEIRGKVVIDFGCGIGAEAIEIAQRGADRVIGIDIREKVLEAGKVSAERAGVSRRCLFTTQTTEKADVIVSLDGFEHYQDPERVLRIFRELIRPNGRVFISFGPPWFHPLGGHLFSVLPWAHLIFTEKALIRWRSDFKSDGATRFCEVEGGLNQITVRRFRTLLNGSEFEIERFEGVPIRKFRFLFNLLTREFLTSVVRCTLIPKRAGEFQTGSG